MEVLTSIFKQLLHISIISFIMFAIIIVLRGLFIRKFSPKYAYLLWLLLLGRLIFPFSIPSSFSIENTIDDNILYFDSAEREVIIEAGENKEPVTYGTIKREVFQPMSTEDKLYQILTYVWLFGIFSVMFIPVISYITLKRAISENDYMLNQRLQKALLDAQRSLGIMQNINMTYSYYVDSPALIGVMSPTIIIPYELKDADYDTMFNVLLHELVHLKKHHLFFQWSFWIIKAIYWFNPIIWLAHHLMKQDAELACDEGVIETLVDDKRIEYGNILISLAENTSNKPYIVNAAGLINKQSELKKRIKKLASYKPVSKLLTFVATVIIIINIPMFFTSKAVINPVAEERIIQASIDAESISNTMLTARPTSYSYNTKTEEIIVNIDYAINKDLYEKLLPSIDFHPSAYLSFPGGASPSIRTNSYNGSVSIVSKENTGQLTARFELEDYNLSAFGKAKLSLGFIEFSKQVEPSQISISPDMLPYCHKIDELVSVEVTDFTIDEEKNEVKLAYYMLTDYPLGIFLNPDIMVKPNDGLSNFNKSTFGSVSDSYCELSTHFSIQADEVTGVDLRFDSYTATLQNMVDALSGNSDFDWRIDIDPEGVIGGE